MTVDRSEKINELLDRSIDTIYPTKDMLRTALESGKKLKVYMGIDPTADYVHLGHSTNYIILKRFHELGHKIVVLVGDFTAMIGDPSDKSSLRVKLTRADVEKNLKTFKAQIGKILDFKNKVNPIEFKFNSTWLSSLSFEDSVELASNFTVQQMIERDTFQKRLTEKKPLYLHEFFYPLMQGYDSVAMDVDVEVGGTDQTFNMLAGRTLLKRIKNKEKIVVTSTLLENPATGEKLMSKSLGTGVGLNESAGQMVGKIMALPDEGVVQCLVDCTYLSLKSIKKLEKEHKNPRDLKLRLADEVASMYHGQVLARKAVAEWTSQFSNRKLPENIREQKVEKSNWKIDELLVELNLAKSKSEARRLFVQGGVRLNKNQLDAEEVSLKSGDIVQVGKRNFVKVKL